MGEKRYFKVEYDEEWYLFDSTTISEQFVKEQANYGYGVFANSLSPSEIMDLLNSLSEDNEQLRQILKDIVGATDETYTKNKNIYKVTVVFDGGIYNQIRRCLNE